MNTPEGYVALELVGFTDKGEYSEEIIYVKNDLVHLENSIWRCLQDDTVGVEPGSNTDIWKIYLRSAAEASGILAVDTEGIVTDAGQKVSTQNLIDGMAAQGKQNLEEINKLKNPEFEDYTGETELPDPEAAVGMIVSGGPVDIIQQYTKASLRGILTIAKKALNIALGRNQARVFASVADLDAWLAVPANTEQLNVGDNFYIVETDVPDYWWDGTQKQKLETQKVDLTTYNQRITANANAISDLTEKLNGKVSTGSVANLGSAEIYGTTPYIDFHYNNSNEDHTSRIIEVLKGVIDIECNELRMNNKNIYPVEHQYVTLTYISSTEMYVEISLARTPVAVSIEAVAQTPYPAVKYAYATRVGDTIKCYAYGSGFVSGHVLSAGLFYI